MDHKYYSQLWLDVRDDLKKIINLDEIVQNAKPTEDRDQAEHEILNLYFRYRKIVQRLIFCFNQIIQPQIREFIKQELDYTVIRMLEIRQEMVNYSFIDYPWPIDILLSLKWTVDDMVLTAPTYDAATRQAEFDRRKTLFRLKNKARGIDVTSMDMVFPLEIDESLYSVSYIGEEGEEEEEDEEDEEEKEKNEDVSKAKVEVKQSPEMDMQEAKRKAFNDAILLIQSHERARVGRRIARNVVRQLMMKIRGSQTVNPKKLNKHEQNKAAIIIQKIWRGFIARQKIQKMYKIIEELLCMTIPSGGNPNILKCLNEAFVQKSSMQTMAMQTLKEFIEFEEKRIEDFRGPTLIEDIRDEIRAWFFEWFEKMGFFDYIPSSDCGGTVLVTTGQSRTPEEYYASLQDSKKNKKGDKKPKNVEPEESKTNEGWQMSESKVIPLLINLDMEFNNKWIKQMKKILDSTGALIHNFIYEDIGQRLQLEMREIADESMRVELESFNAALKLDRAGTEFTLPIPQPCEAVIQEENPGTELLPNSTIDDLIIELMSAKVIQEIPECQLSEWPGAPSYVCKRDGEIRLGDIKQAVMDYCVLPIGSKVIHQLAPFMRSVCICGPPGAGQIFIARAICNELKATIFNLTPERHKGRYKSRASQERLVQAIMKLARAFPPAVILVEGNLAWLKQVPSELRKIDPKRFSPIYKKIVGLIRPGDQVLFLTAATHPYLADKSFIKLHDKFIIIPVADYGTTYVAYKKSLMSHHAIPRNFDVSAVARVVAKDTPLEFAEGALDECLKIQRRMEFKRRPLRPVDILEALCANVNRPHKKELELFDKFRFKLPHEKKRQELVQELKEAEEQKDQGKIKK